MEHFAICRPDCTYLRIKKMFICGSYIDYFLCRIGGSDIGCQLPLLVRRVINRGIVEKEAIINNLLNAYWMAGFSFRLPMSKNSQSV